MRIVIYLSVTNHHIQLNQYIVDSQNVHKYFINIYTMEYSWFDFVISDALVLFVALDHDQASNNPLSYAFPKH